MSLDVSLCFPDPDAKCQHCGHPLPNEVTEVFEANITHNLNKMADAAGIYGACWRPEEHGITHARDLIQPLADGLARLKADPAKFSELNAKNGWGMYGHFVPWVERYLEACIENPDALVRASR